MRNTHEKQFDVKRPSHQARLQKRWQDAVIPGAELGMVIEMNWNSFKSLACRKVCLKRIEQMDVGFVCVYT